MEKILIGTGALSWAKKERVTDRYGFVGLFNEDSEDKKIAEDAALLMKIIPPLLNKKFKMVAEVLETRKSTHIGDLQHGYRPVTPEKGDMIELGEGYLQHYELDGCDYVGLKPIMAGKHWMDAKALYRAHEQTVNLYLIPSA